MVPYPIESLQRGFSTRVVGLSHDNLNLHQ